MSDFKLPDEDARLALQYSEDTDMNRFRLGKLVSLRVLEYSDHGVPVADIYREFAKATRGLSVRTLRFYAETVAHYTDADWEEYSVLSFDHFARAAFLARNGFVPMAKFALDWALQFAEKKGKGNFATADEMTGNFLPQEEIEKRELRRRLSAFRTIRADIDRLPEETRKMAERLLIELEKILNGYKPEKKMTDEEKDQVLEQAKEEAKAKRHSQRDGITLYTISQPLTVPKGTPGFHTVSGIRDAEGALLWGAKNHYREVFWLKQRERVYVVKGG